MPAGSEGAGDSRGAPQGVERVAREKRPADPALWNDFNQARGKQDEPNADAALEKIDGVYASFKPQHDRFFSELSRF